MYPCTMNPNVPIATYYTFIHTVYVHLHNVPKCAHSYILYMYTVIYMYTHSVCTLAQCARCVNFSCAQTIMAHCIHMKGAEMELAKKRNMGMVHCPSSNCKWEWDFHRGHVHVNGDYILYPIPNL